METHVFTVYNVHSLIHLSSDVEHFKCSLNDVSAFPFENYLQTLKKSVRQSQNPIAQVTKRLTELEKSRFKCVVKNKFPRISTTPKDGCFLLKNNDFAFVKEKRQDGQLVCDVVGQHITENLFTSPCNSKLLDISRIRNFARAKRCLIERGEICRKVACLPLELGYALFPLLHDTEH